MEAHFRAKYPKSPEDSDGVYKSVIRAKALDTLRGLLPAATTSNVGLFGTGQAFEALLLRMFAHPLEEVRGCARDMLDRTAPGDSCVSRAHRSAGPWRPLDRLLHRRRDTPLPTPPRRLSTPRLPSRETRSPDRLRSRRRDQGRRIGALQHLGAARRSAPRHRAPHVAGRSRRPAPRLRRRSRQSPPQAGPGIRAHRATASTCSPTTARSAICSAIAC